LPLGQLLAPLLLAQVRDDRGEAREAARAQRSDRKVDGPFLSDTARRQPDLRGDVRAAGTAQQLVHQLAVRRCYQRGERAARGRGVSDERAEAAVGVDDRAVAAQDQRALAHLLHERAPGLVRCLERVDAPPAQPVDHHGVHLAGVDRVQRLLGFLEASAQRVQLVRLRPCGGRTARR
jgi:hypothetical protein